MIVVIIGAFIGISIMLDWIIGMVDYDLEHRKVRDD